MSFVEDWDRIEVTVTSPDRTVRGTLTALLGMRIAFRDDALRRHDEVSLVQQISSVVHGLNRGNIAALNAVLERHGTELEVDTGRDVRDRDAIFEKEVRAIEVARASYSDNVRVRLVGSGEFSLKLRPGCVNQIGMDSDKLAQEINTVLGEAMQDLGTQRQAIYRRVHGGES